MKKLKSQFSASHYPNQGCVQMFREFAKEALDKAEGMRASYADIRTSDILNEILTVKDGEPETVTQLQRGGFGIRVIADGAWGFAGSIDIDQDEVRRTVERAVSVARASALLKRRDVSLAPQDAQEDHYVSSFKKNPFDIPLEEKLEVLMQASRTIKGQSQLIRAAYAHYLRDIMA